MCKALLCTVVAAMISGIAIGLALLVVIYSGAYNVAATDQHGALTAWALHTTALHSIDARAADINVPDLSNQTRIGEGFQLFRDHCVQCHGAPGEPPADFAKGLLPSAPRLEQIGREWNSRTIYWTVAHGIKMTAMPAWEFRLTPDDIWDIVVFVKVLPSLLPTAYAAMAAKAGPPRRAVVQASDEPPHLDPGNSKRGKIAVAQYACDSCHEIPGISEPVALVGPPLNGIGSRVLIAGLLPNTPDNMQEWILHPQQIKPGDEMPDMGVSNQDARDMTAYLESLQ
jgi:mono/diheme cytochrome c family protein/cytochrome c2